MTVEVVEGERRRGRAWTWIVVVAALALVTWGRIALVDRLHDQGFFVKYTLLADRILAGDIPRDRIGDVSPAYLWLTVAFRYMGLTLRSIRTLQIVGLTAAALLCGLAAKRLGGWVAAVVAVVLILGNRAALVIATDLEPETLILLLTGGAMLAAIAWQQGRRNAHLVAGFLLGLSAVARPVAIATIVLFALWALYRALRALPGDSARVKKRAAFEIVAVAAIPIVVVLLVNRALTGNVIIMTPGTHVYEGNNPLATAAAGVMPKVVADMNVETDQPDYVHVAYRLVAARATGQPVDVKRANAFWSRRAFAYMREYPVDALGLFFWKGVLSVHHYDVYDLVTTATKARELSRYPAVPFGLAFVLSVAAFVLHRRRSELLVGVVFVLATLAALVAFNVSARQRDALLAPLAVLGGVAVADLVALARARSDRALLAFGGIVIITPILGIEGPPMREDAHNWWAARESDALVSKARRARAAGNGPAAAMLAATASVLRTDETPLVSAANLAPIASRIANESETPATIFDAAIALEKAGAWREADEALQSIENYRPRREQRAVSSVAYYRARAAMHLGADLDSVRGLLEEAQREAPGDPDVLALSMLLGHRESARVIDEIHDPFTRDFALARAWLDLGRTDRAVALLRSLEARIPEWSRPRRTRLAVESRRSRP